MGAVIAFCLIPIALLNLLSGLVGFLWLAFRGDWSVIIPGAAYAILGPFGLSIALAPGLLFLAPISSFVEKGRNILAFVFGVPAICWTLIVFSTSVIYMFTLTAVKGDGSLPSLLWAYATSLAPWSYMAQKDQQAGNEYSGVLTGCATLGMVSMMVAVLRDSTDLSFERMFWYFLPFVIVAFVMQAASAIFSSSRIKY